MSAKGNGTSGESSEQRLLIEHSCSTASLGRGSDLLGSWGVFVVFAVPGKAGRTKRSGGVHRAGSAGLEHPKCGSPRACCTWIPGGPAEADIQRQPAEGRTVAATMIAGASWPAGNPCYADAGRWLAEPSGWTFPLSSHASRVHGRQLPTRDPWGLHESAISGCRLTY